MSETLAEKQQRIAQLRAELEAEGVQAPAPAPKPESTGKRGKRPINQLALEHILEDSIESILQPYHEQMNIDAALDDLLVRLGDNPTFEGQSFKLERHNLYALGNKYGITFLRKRKGREKSESKKRELIVKNTPIKRQIHLYEYECPNCNNKSHGWHTTIEKRYCLCFCYKPFKSGNDPKKANGSNGIRCLGKHILTNDDASDTDNILVYRYTCTECEHTMDKLHNRQLGPIPPGAHKCPKCGHWKSLHYEFVKSIKEPVDKKSEKPIEKPEEELVEA